MMEEMLDDVRRDAIKKLRSAEDKDIRLLLDAASHILALGKLAREHGLLALEMYASRSQSEFCKLAVLDVVDATEPEDVIEHTTNKYWTKNPEGVHAMAAYFYIRGILYIQSSDKTKILEYILRSLIPKNWHTKYDEMLMQHKKPVSERYSGIHPVFQDKSTRENISALEMELRRLPDHSVQRLVQDTAEHALADCVFALHEEMRRKIMDNLSEQYTSEYMDVVFFHPLSTADEKIVSESILFVLYMINKLRDAGKL